MPFQTLSWNLVDCKNQKTVFLLIMVDRDRIAGHKQKKYLMALNTQNWKKWGFNLKKN